jgi:hypothetical protein
VGRIGIVALALIAAFAAPVRAACGATCVEPPAVEIAPAEPACHEVARSHAGDPAAPEAGHCSHDHSASVRPAPRAAAADAAPAAVALLASPALDAPILVAATVDPPPPGSTRGSPPARLLQLRL